MKKSKGFYIVLLLASAIILLPVLMITCMNLKPLYQRTSFSPPALSQKERNEIQAETQNFTTDRQLFDYAIDKAGERLHFTMRNNLKNNGANCIGYTALAKAYLNYALSIHGKRNKTYHYVGTVHSFGISLNMVLQSFLPEKHKLFVKDHDFLGMKADTGELILASPTLKDLTGFSAYTVSE